MQRKARESAFFGSDTISSHSSRPGRGRRRPTVLIPIVTIAAASLVCTGVMGLELASQVADDSHSPSGSSGVGPASGPCGVQALLNQTAGYAPPPLVQLRRVQSLTPHRRTDPKSLSWVPT
jgi:hypothetical protein